MVTLSTLISAAALAYVGYVLIQWWDIRKSRREMSRGTAAGLSALVGTYAEVVEAFTHSGATMPARGRVRIGSELWEAELDNGRLAAAGEEVQVIGATGLLLKVKCR
jgi:membrane protein implicated in regulation of membrane protease activity